MTVAHIRILGSVWSVTRVWLTGWEWACCGDAFAVGDVVDFGIQSRMPAAALAEALGDELAPTVDAIESHHEEEFVDRVQGCVTAIHAVTREVIERRILRRPGHGAPLSATMPEDGEEWPMVGRDLGNGVFVGSRPTRYMIEAVPVADSARLAPVHDVRLPDSLHGEAGTTVAEPTDDPPVERRTRSLSGWLVDVEEQ
jgi:hypothetical protein